MLGNGDLDAKTPIAAFDYPPSQLHQPADPRISLLRFREGSSDSYVQQCDAQQQGNKMPVPPNLVGGHGFWGLCSEVSYFSTLLGSIIGAGRLSFRVRDGSGRFPVAVAAVTLLGFVFWWWGGVVVGVVACV